MTHSLVKECLVGLLRLSGVLRLFRWLNRHHLIILTYHGVVPPGSGLKAYESRNVVDQEMFSWQMRYLATHYHCLPLEQAVRRLAEGGTLPKYAVAVTFDDGFQNNLRHAVPVLQRWRVPATVFLTTGHIGQGTKMLWTERVGRLLGEAPLPQSLSLRAGSAPLTLVMRSEADREPAVKQALKRLKATRFAERERALADLEGQVRNGGHQSETAPNHDRYAFLTWTEAGQLLREGMTVGSHTVHHPILTSLEGDVRMREVVESKEEIERRLATPCTLFSYPNGTTNDFDEGDKANLQRAGYLAAVSQINGVNDVQTDRFALKRLNIGHGHTPQLFAAQVSGLWPWARAMVGRA